MTLELFTLICFSIGVGVSMLVSEKTINEIARIVGGIAGIVYGLLLIFNR